MENSAQNVSIYKMYANKIIRFMPSQKTLELAGGDEVRSKAEKNAFEWYLKKIDEDRYYILMNDETALSYNLSDWSVKLSRLEEGDKSQIWRITKKGGQGYE